MQEPLPRLLDPGAHPPPDHERGAAAVQRQQGVPAGEEGAVRQTGKKAKYSQSFRTGKSWCYPNNLFNYRST